MAVPTITRILPYGSPVGTPAIGPTVGGSYVEIYGSGFRLASEAAPLEDGPTSDPFPTVRVTFGGVEAPRVNVVRSNLLRVVTPRTPLDGTEADNHGEGDVDVVVQNLDDNGDPIGSESVTLVDGFRFNRPRLDSNDEGKIQYVTRRLRRELARGVHPNVIITEDVDFDADTSTPYTELAELPALVLVGPSTRENRFYSLNAGQEEEVEEGVWREFKRPVTLDLVYEVIGIMNASHVLLKLMEATTEWLNRTVWLEALRDPNDASKGSVRWELSFADGGHFSVGRSPNASNIRHFSGTIVVRGVDVNGFEGMVSDEVYTVDEEASDGVRLDVGSSGG